jgi:hypothetical protein
VAGFAAFPPDYFALGRQLPLMVRSCATDAEEQMTIEQQTTVHLRQQVMTLEAACQRLLLRPDDALGRERLVRTIAAMELATLPGDSPFVRGLVDEVRAHADSLAFRLERPGYDCLHISARTALLCQTLAHLRLQLPTLGGEAMAG